MQESWPNFFKQLKKRKLVETGLKLKRNVAKKSKQKKKCDEKE